MTPPRGRAPGRGVCRGRGAGLFAQAPAGSSELRIVVRNALARPRAGETVEVPARRAAADRRRRKPRAPARVRRRAPARSCSPRAWTRTATATDDLLVFQADFARGRRARLCRAARRAARLSQGGLPRLRTVRAGALRRLRLGKRPRGPSHVRRGARDLGAGAAHQQHARRVGEAHAPAGRQRLVHGGRLPPRPRRGRRLLLRGPQPRLRGQRRSGATASSASRATSAARACWPAGPIRLVFELTLPALGHRRAAARWPSGSASPSTPARTSTASTAPTPCRRHGRAVLGRGHQEGGGRRRARREGGGLDPHLGADPGRQRPSRLRVLLDPAALADVTEAARERPGGGAARRPEGARPTYAGSAWDSSGDFAGVADWDRHVQEIGGARCARRSRSKSARADLAARAIRAPSGGTSPHAEPAGRRSRPLRGHDHRGAAGAFLVEDLFAPGEVRLAALGAGADDHRRRRARRRPARAWRRRRRSRPPSSTSGASWASSTSAARARSRWTGSAHELGPRDVLYVGRGAREVDFASAAAETPAPLTTW